MKRVDKQLVAIFISCLILAAVGYLVERDLNTGLAKLPGLTLKQRAEIVKRWEDNPCRVVIDKQGEPQLVQLSK